MAVCHALFVWRFHNRCWWYVTRAVELSASIYHRLTDAATAHSCIARCSSTPDVWSFIHDIQIAIPSNRSASITQATCREAALPVCRAAQNLRFRYLILTLSPEKRWSLRIPKCTASDVRLRWTETNLRYFTLSMPPEKRWSLTIPKCMVVKHSLCRQLS
jgi:hypothetical protein